MSKKNQSFKVIREKGRLDVFLAKKLKISRAQAQRLFQQGLVSVNKGSANKHHAIKSGDLISIKTIAKSQVKLPPLKVISATPDYIFIDKPAGIVVHPDNIHPKGTTLIDLIISKFPDIKGVGEDKLRPGMVHRLDKNVSGVMVVARTQEMFKHLKKQFQTRSVFKEYLALVYGIVNKEQIIEQPLQRSKQGKIIGSSNGRRALTIIKPEKKFGNATLLHVQIKTGRTHQIKAHLLGIGHPLVGERVYIGTKYKNHKYQDLLDRPFLQAAKLGFNMPTGERLEAKSALPRELQQFLRKIDKSA